MAATLSLSAFMVRSPIFGLPTAAIGITAGVLGLAYFAAAALPASRIFVLEGAGATFLVWLALVGIRVGRHDPSGAT